MAIKRRVLAGVLLLLFVAAAVLRMLSPQPWYAADLVLSRDQQGVWLLKQGKYLQAAQRFDNPQWRAYAYYAAAQFATAGRLFAATYDAEAYFNRANAKAHLGAYHQASDLYAMALALQADFPAATANADLVAALQHQAASVADKNSHSEGKLAADDVVFDLNANDSTSTTAAEASLAQVSAHERYAIWLKGLNTRPADFLKQKFYYQYQAQAEQ